MREKKKGRNQETNSVWVIKAQLRLRAQQCVVATAEDSVLRTEMENLESEEEDAPRRV